jgi:arginine exporter protein ArgO
MTAALVAGLVAGYGIAVPVGAVGTYLVALTARTSWRTGACAALGVATADGVYALIAMIGGSALAQALQPLMSPLRLLAGSVLVVLAVRGAATAVAQYRRPGKAARSDGTPRRPARAFLGLWGVTMMNPVTVIYFAALVLGGQASATADRLDRAVFVLAAFAASASWQLLLAGGGALLGRLLTGGRGRLVTAVLSSTVMAALALRMLAAPGS